MDEKYAYMFSEGNTEMKELLGEKGANLAEMTNMGLSVPQGFTVSTKACSRYYDNDEKISNDIISEIYERLGTLEETTGKKFGLVDNPLLLAVRAGARITIPGIKCSILNIGLNSEITKKLEEKNEKVALDCYRILIQMYGNIVKGIEEKNFIDVIENTKRSKNIQSYYDLQPEDLRQLILNFKEIYKNATGEDFPEDPNIQLKEAIGAMFKFWNNARTIIYRKENNIPNEWGTAVNVQEMVFGNINEHSGVGTVFSRNPETGENSIYGKFLLNTQMLGIKEPNPIEQLKNINSNIYDEIIKDIKLLENHYKDMQNIEFVIENEKLYLLQTRSGARTAEAALKIATDLVDENVITEKEAVLKVEPIQLEELFNKELNNNEGSNQLLSRFMNWVDQYRQLKIRADIKNTDEAKMSYTYGAEGISFCKTMNMFLGDERINIIKEITSSNNIDEKNQALEKLLEIQKQDFINLYKEINGYPITIRLLDLTEYKTLLQDCNDSVSLSYTEILKMQIKAIIKACVQVNSEEEMNIVPEIMIPRVGDENEAKYLRGIIGETVNDIIKQQNIILKYEVGAMIEIPRATLLANEIARQCVSFIFETDKLTQLILGINKDETNEILKKYYNEGIYGFNPFYRIDEKSVGKIIKLAVESGRKTRPDIKLGVCGEQTNDSKSIEIFHNAGLAYVCCSAEKIPMAKLAAAQAAIKNPRT